MFMPSVALTRSQAAKRDTNGYASSGFYRIEIKVSA